MTTHIWQILVRFSKSTWIFAWYLKLPNWRHPIYQNVQNLVRNTNNAFSSAKTFPNHQGNKILEIDFRSLWQRGRPLILNQGVPNVNIRAGNRFSGLVCSGDFWTFRHPGVVYSRSWANFELSDILDVSSRLVQLSRENPRGFSKSD